MAATDSSDGGLGQFGRVPHLVSLGLVRIHLLHEHEAQPFLLLTLFSAPLKLRHAHLGLDILVILLVIVRNVPIYCAPRATRPAPTARHRHRPSARNARRTLLLRGLARLVSLAFPASLLLHSAATTSTSFAATAAGSADGRSGHHADVVVVETHAGGPRGEGRLLGREGRLAQGVCGAD